MLTVACHVRKSGPSQLSVWWIRVNAVSSWTSQMEGVAGSSRSSLRSLALPQQRGNGFWYGWGSAQVIPACTLLMCFSAHFCQDAEWFIIKEGKVLEVTLCEKPSNQGLKRCQWHLHDYLHSGSLNQMHVVLDETVKIFGVHWPSGSFRMFRTDFTVLVSSDTGLLEFASSGRNKYEDVSKFKLDLR